MNQIKRDIESGFLKPNIPKGLLPKYHYDEPQLTSTITYDMLHQLRRGFTFAHTHLGLLSQKKTERT